MFPGLFYITRIMRSRRENVGSGSHVVSRHLFKQP